MALRTNDANFLKKALSLISCRVRDLGAIVLMAMVLLVVVDVSLRRLFNSPLPFSFELIGIMLVIVVYCFVAYSTSTGRHVGVDVLTTRFPPKTKTTIDLVMDFLSAVLFGLIGWQSIVQGIHIWDIGTETGILRIPYYPFLFVVALGSILACLALIIGLAYFIIGALRK